MTAENHSDIVLYLAMLFVIWFLADCAKSDCDNNL